MKSLFGACLVLCLSLATFAAADKDQPKVLFEDKFDAKLEKEWSWLREDPSAWRNSPQGLEIRVQPGGKDNVKNALLRAAPDRARGKYAIEVTVEYLAPPTVK